MLCPEVYTWHPIEECIKLLNANKYSRFAPRGKSDQAITEDQDQIDNIDNVKIKLTIGEEMKIINFKDFCTFLRTDFIPEFEYLVLNYCKLFGKKVSERIKIKF